MKARDCRSDRLIQPLDNGLQVGHLAPEPVVDVGVVRRWLRRLSPYMSPDFFGHRVSSCDERVGVHLCGQQVIAGSGGARSHATSTESTRAIVGSGTATDPTNASMPSMTASRR